MHNKQSETILNHKLTKLNGLTNTNHVQWDVQIDMKEQSARATKQTMHTSVESPANTSVEKQTMHTSIEMICPTRIICRIEAHNNVQTLNKEMTTTNKTKTTSGSAMYSVAIIMGHVAIMFTQ